MVLSQKYLVFINTLLALVSMGYALHLQGNGSVWLVNFLWFISVSALINVYIAQLSRWYNLGHYILMALGTSFTLILYFTVTENAVGAVWLHHVLLFSYYHLGYKKGLIWSSAFFSLFISIHIFIYYFSLQAPYSWDFILSYITSLFISFVGLYGYASMVETIKDEKNEKTRLLGDALMEVKKTQKRLVEAEKMSALGQLVNGVAHEINTPVGNSLTGATYIHDETKLMIKAFETGEIRKKSLQNYLLNVEQMSNTITNSLYTAGQTIHLFKQISIDEHVETKRYFNLQGLTNEIILTTSEAKGNINIINRVDTELNIYSYVDVFNQIISSLIQNALIHAFDDNSDGNITINAHIADQYFYLIFQDDGKGLDSQTIKKIFTPFYSSKMGGKGKGLGLSILYNLVHHKLKGEIECESTLGNGVKIAINLPLKEISNNNISEATFEYTI